MTVSIKASGETSTWLIAIVILVVALASTMTLASIWAALISIDGNLELIVTPPSLSASTILPLTSLMCLYACVGVAIGKVSASWMMMFGPALFITLLYCVMFCTARYGGLFGDEHQLTVLGVLTLIPLASVAVIPSIVRLGAANRALLSKGS